MSLQCRPVFRISCVMALIVVGAVAGFAQQPADFSVGPTTIVQGDCYDMWVTPSLPGIHLDIQYTINSGPVQTIYDWPVLDETGFARNICTGSGTVAGSYVFLSVRNSLATDWVVVGKSLTVLPQPTGLSFDSSSGYAGIDHYVITVSGGASMNLRVRYDWNGYENLISTISTNATGQYDSGLFDHYLYIGSYVITGVQNAAAQPGNWVTLNAPYTILPPQPTSFYLDKSLVFDEGTATERTYRMYAGNGAEIPIDFQYRIDDGPLQEVDYWPWLNRDSPTSWNGHSDDIVTGSCTIPGIYRFSAVRNSLNAAWISISPPVQMTVVGPGAPQISSVSPENANPGQSVSVVINGQRLCGVSLTTAYPGLSVVSGSSPSENQIFATFSVSPTAPAGNALVTLHAYGGNADFYFGINHNGTGAPLITGVAPASAARPSSVTVTFTGANLFAPVVSTTWPGLTFSNVTPNGSGATLTATFTVSPSAALGNPTISVTTPGGVATTQLFSIQASTLPSLSREYLYLGDRVLAVESP